MVDGWEIAVEVASEHMAEPVLERLVTGDGPMRALSRAVGVAVMDEAPLEKRFRNGAEGMMNDPVPEGSGGDHPVLGVDDFEGLAAARPIGPATKFPLWTQDFLLRIGEEAPAPGFDRLPRTAFGTAACRAETEAMSSNTTGSSSRAMRLDSGADASPGVAEEECLASRKPIRNRDQPEGEAVMRFQRGTRFAGAVAC